MKDLNELNLADDVRYTKDHEWARKLDGARFRVGISDYAQDQLGDIVFVEVPEVGASFESGQEVGTLESVKAVAEIYTPLSGKVAAVNEALEDLPGLVNQVPYGAGWIFELEATNPHEFEELMDKDAYLEMLKGVAA